MILHVLMVGPIQENTYIVGSEETRKCLVIDPGAEANYILKEIQGLGLTVKLIINTHGHSDHIGAVAAIKEATGAPYAIHQRDVPLLSQGGSWVRSMVPDFRDPPEPDQYIQEGDTIDVGELTFQVLETPGHSPGGVCFYGHGVVFTGDTLFQSSIGRFDSPGGDGRQLLQMIHTKLMPLPPQTKVYPGHGPATSIAQEKLMNPFLNPEGGLLLP